MRKYWIIASALVAAFVFINQWRMNQELRSFRAAHAIAESQSAIPDGSETDLRDVQSRLDQTRLELANAERQIVDLTTKLQTLQKKLADLSTNASEKSQIVSVDTGLDTIPDAIKGRRWGPEQAIGAPDTPGAGDYATAWAPLKATGGLEWLKLDYQNMVDVAQIHIRETYNPGAVYKITAIAANGLEYTLWEGTEAPGPAPYDSAFTTSTRLYTQSIKIYLDTSRVASWSEIDAVELVGKDGFRQWATGASASSSYAEQFATADNPRLITLENK